MKHFLPYCFTLILLSGYAANLQAQCIHTVVCEICQAEGKTNEIVDSLVVSDPEALFDSMPQPVVNYDRLNLSLVAKIFSGYQPIAELPKLSNRPLKYQLAVMTPIEETDTIIEYNDTIVEKWTIKNEILDIEKLSDKLPEETVIMETSVAEENSAPALPSLLSYKTPKWLRDAVRTAQFQENTIYSYMIDNPMAIEYAYWDLPLPPVLLEEDRSFIAFLRKQEIPEISASEAILPEEELKRKNWLHKVGAQLQFSQAYVSPNWYQGGNNYLSMLFGFNWKVNLNQVYYPKILFQSDFQYKVAFSSNPKGYQHKYTIAEDNFQYNLNTGLKAAKDWYYSFNLQFKTQLFNNFEENSNVRTAAFLSPADLNMGLGMSYNHKNKLGTFQYTLTVSPLSYNMKVCLKNNDIIDHATYGIAADKHTKSEIGSNLDFTMDWRITANISYKTRMFMFTDYHYFLGDWQNTFNFDINKFLSTQLFVHLRYDGSTENYGRWKKFMMREILSFGLSYTFSTKP